MQFRAEMFNVFNQVNFNNPDTQETDGTFGVITSAQPGRVIQFAFKATLVSRPEVFGSGRPS